MAQEQHVPIIHQGLAAERRTQGLGVPGTWLLNEAALVGAAGARNTTRLHPNGTRGMRMWSDMVAHLRLRLLQHGWDIDDIYNIPVAINRELAPLAMIVVAPGDEHTGTLEPPQGPGLRYVKREFSSKFYNRELEDLWTRSKGLDGYEVWMIVQSLMPNSIRLELSRPDRFENGRVRAWSERILLPELDLGAPEPEKANRPDLPDIDFDVALRE